MLENLKKLNTGRIRVKVIGAMLAMILTFSNFTLLTSYLGKASYATDLELSKQDDSTNNSNVKFEAYLDTNQREVKEKVANINSEDVKLYISVSVQNEGYLRNAKIKFESTNFKIKGNEQITEFPLDTVQTGKNMTVEIPIEAVNNEKYNLGLLSMISKIKLTGEYIDNKGNITDIEESKKVKITWKTDKISEEDLNLSQEVITNKIYEINGEAKRVIQVLVKSGVKENIVPVKQTYIEMSIPEIEALPEEVKVSSYSTKATNGKTAIEFADLETSKWEYNKNERKVKIQIVNPADEQGSIVWAKNAQDEIIVTYIYGEDAKVAPFISNVKFAVEIYGAENNAVVGKIDNLQLEELQEIGDIAKIENQVSTEIYKGNLYINEAESYAQIYNIYVSYKELANKIQIEDLGDEILEEASTYYKKTAINKKEAINVLGEEGIINIYNAENRELIQKIDLSEETRGDYIIVEYAEGIERIVIGTSPAQKEGKIEVINQKEIKVLDGALVQEINGLISNVNLLVADEGSKVVANINSKAEAKLIEPSTKYSISLDKTKLVTAVENDLQITAELKTENSSDKLFVNPEIRIELPVEITEARIENITPILHSEELKLKSCEVLTNESGNKEIVIQTEGMQTKYTQNNAYVAIYLKVEVEALIASKDTSIKIACINGEEKVEDIKKIELVSKSGFVTESIEKEIVEKMESYTPMQEEQASLMSVEAPVLNIQASVAKELVGIKISPKAMTETLYQGQVVTYEITAKNNGEEDLENVKLVYTVPEGAVITELTYAQGTEIEYTDKENIGSRTITLEGKLKVGQERTADITLRIKEDATQIINNIVATSANDEEIGSLTTNPVEVISGDLNVMLSRRDNWAISKREGDTILGVVNITNNTSSQMSNLRITSKLPEGTVWMEDSEYNENWTYNKQTREISYTINALNSGEIQNICFESKVDKMNSNTYEDKIENMVLVTTKEGTEYASNIYSTIVKKPGYKITMTSEHSEILKEGDKVKYIINVTNIGKTSTMFILIDEVPEEIEIKEVIYYNKAEESGKIIETSDNNSVNLLVANSDAETIVIEIQGEVKTLENGVTSKKITNIAKIPLGENEYAESNEMTNTIIKNSDNQGGSNLGGGEDNQGGNNSEDNNQGGNNSGDSNQGENNTGNNNQGGNNSGGNNLGDNNTEEGNTGYSISGTVWLDKNKDGIRNSNEEVMQSQRIVLLDEEGNIASETLSSLTGTYKFTNLPKGKYLVAIVYDESKYTVTKYQALAAKESDNSDIITKQIKLDGKNMQVGITDTLTINSIDITNIDMGLIENPAFDLSLNKYISKIVVTTSKEVKTYEYDEPTNLAKVEIGAKEISGATILVEYEIEVVNEGDVVGYVTDIIDYLPKELTFSSEMNSEWYKSGDGYLHYIALEPKPINPGESQKIKLVLTRDFKNNGAGIIENTAEIGASTNLEGIAELDSIVGNHKDGEDDISKAELIVSIKTGGVELYIGIVIISIIILGIGIYIINKKVLRVRI